MYGFALAAMTKPHSLGASNNTSSSLTVLETGSLRSRYGRVGSSGSRQGNCPLLPLAPRILLSVFGVPSVFGVSWLVEASPQRLPSSSRVPVCTSVSTCPPFLLDWGPPYSSMTSP